MTNLFARTLERIPQDVRILADDAAVQVAGATNIFLTPLGLVDSDGGRVDHYALFFTTNLFNPIGGVIAAVVGFLHLLFMVVAGYAVWLIEAIVNPDKLLGWMSGLFQSLTSRVYAVFPPQALVAATFAILILRIFLLQDPTDVKIGGATFSKTRLSKAHWQRLASGFALMGLVLALAANPFRLAQIVLSGVSTFAAFLTGNDAAALHRTMVSGTVDQILKPMTQLLTYHDTLAPQCSAVWSAAVNSGNAASVKSCLTPEQVQATSPGPITLLLAVLALGVAACFAYFAVITLKNLGNHIARGIYHTVVLSWVGALSLAQRRQYDPLIKEISYAGRNYIMVLGIVLVISVIPTWFLQIVHSVTWLPLWLQFILIGVGYVLTAQAVEQLTKTFKGDDKLTAYVDTTVEKSKPMEWLFPKHDREGANGPYVSPLDRKRKERDTQDSATDATPQAAGPGDPLDSATQQVNLGSSTPQPRPAPSGPGVGATLVAYSSAEAAAAVVSDVDTESSATASAYATATGASGATYVYSQRVDDRRGPRTSIRNTWNTWLNALPYRDLRYLVANNFDGELSAVQSPDPDYIDAEVVDLPIRQELTTGENVVITSRGGIPYVEEVPNLPALMSDSVRPGPPDDNYGGSSGPSGGGSPAYLPDRIPTWVSDGYSSPGGSGGGDGWRGLIDGNASGFRSELGYMNRSDPFALAEGPTYAEASPIYPMPTPGASRQYSGSSELTLDDAFDGELVDPGVGPRNITRIFPIGAGMAEAFLQQNIWESMNGQRIEADFRGVPVEIYAGVGPDGQNVLYVSHDTGFGDYI